MQNKIPSRIEIGTYLKRIDTVTTRNEFEVVDNIVIKNGVLDRIYCTRFLGTFNAGKTKILAKDLHLWKEVPMVQPS